MSQAIRYARYGDPDVLTLDEVPTPDPGPGQVRVAVRAAGVNGIDWKIRRGFMARGHPLDEPLDAPAGTGIEFAGTVDALGAGVQGWRVGQAVFGQVSSGAAATHVPAASGDLLAKPGWLSCEQAAALPVAAETAYLTLRQLGVSAGQTLLVHAVAGGVELAGDAEKVITIADGRAAEYGVRFSTGADGVPLREVFAEVLPLLERDALRVPIERTFPLERTADTQRLSEEGHLRGKIVITVP
ncbi:NADP-dependent oxidoreductase [Streptosporangium roseum]|uniref:NADP-dependent oxidoreductase n=1 Tax=Streptosporangium roseum TaxID=2001 RepID=UPI00332FA9C0